MKKNLIFTTFLLFCHSFMYSQVSCDCLIAKYYFNNGNANDDVGPYNGTTVGATLVPDRFGNSNSAYYLNGTPNSYIKLGTTPLLKPLTCSVSMWVNIAAPVLAGSGYTYNPMLLTKCQPGNNCYESYCLYYDFSNGLILTGCTQLPCFQPAVGTSNSVSLNLWHHLVITYDNNFLNLYLDDVLQGTASKGFASFFLAGDSVMIGNSANTFNNRFFNGTVDDIRFYKCILSQTDVDSLYIESPLDLYDCDSILSMQTDTVKSSVEVPNVFSPNGDGLNDLFIFNSAGLSELHCSIYNRWGTKVYEIFAPGDGWDGRSTSGQKCSDGTYYFVYDAKGKDDTTYKGSSFLQLMR
jgi:gliding motility-associated-like protein